MTHHYEIGDFVTYKTFGDALRTVRVTGKHDDIKNGRAGFDGILDYATPYQTTVWGYDSQITGVQRRGDASCEQCGRPMNAVDRMLGPVCGACVRANHAFLTR